MKAKLVSLEEIEMLKKFYGFSEASIKKLEEKNQLSKVIEEKYQRALEDTFEGQVRKFRAAVRDLLLLAGDPLWQFIKRHPRLYWFWNKSRPLIDAIRWFFPIDLGKK